MNPRKNGVSEVIVFSFACGRRPRAKLNTRTERSQRKVAAPFSLWSVYSDIGCLRDGVQALGPLRSLGLRGTGPWPQSQNKSLPKMKRGGALSWEKVAKG